MRAIVIAATLFTVAAAVQEPAFADKAERDKKKRHKEAQVHLQAGLDQMGQGVFDRALEEFQSAEAFEPTPEITQHIGECEEALGKLPDAITSYQRYLQDSPGAPDAEQVKKHISELEGASHAEKARKLAEDKKWGEAIPEFEAALKSKPEAKLWYDLGNVQENKGDNKAAIESYKEYLKAAPDATDAAEVEARIKVLSGERMAPPPPPPAPPAPPTRKPFYTNKLGLGLAGGGVLVALAGVISLGIGSSAGAARDVSHSETDFLSNQDRGINAGRAGAVLLGVGLVAAVVGGVMLYLWTRPVGGEEPTDPKKKDFVPQARLRDAGPLAFTVGESY